MANPGLSKDVLQQACNLYAKHGGNAAAAARELGIPTPTFRDRVDAAKRAKLAPTNTAVDPDNVTHLRAKIKTLEQELRAAAKEGLGHAQVKQGIIKLAEDAALTEAPQWTIDTPASDSSPGVPTLFLSDLHWGEVVDPRQINGVNKFNMKIARERLHTLGKRAVQLLKIISPKLRYPGIVIPLGGDMVTGNIHDELTATNELNSMPVLLDLLGEMIALIDHMLAVFGRAHLPCVSGNHGRATTKIWSKDRHHTSFDWLLYQLLAKHYERDKRVTFQIPDGPDAYYKVFNTRYLLTHGDKLGNGGDGLIGFLGPVTRGDNKKRGRNSQINMPYDVLLLGHWHQYAHLTKLIANGSLKGLDEYAYGGNFPFEHPQQALWLTHPTHGVTFRMPVFLNDSVLFKATPWVSVPGERA